MSSLFLTTSIPVLLVANVSIIFIICAGIPITFLETLNIISLPSLSSEYKSFLFENLIRACNNKFWFFVKATKTFHNKWITKPENIVVEPKIVGKTAADIKVADGNKEREKIAAVKPKPIDKALIVQTTIFIPKDISWAAINPFENKENFSNQTP